MSIKKAYAVFGLGKYGKAVAKELANSGAEVLAVDLDEGIVNSLAGEIPFCKCANITDVDVIKQLGIGNMDVVVVATSNLEASVLAVVLCKEAGVRTVIAKCADETHQKILSRVGADKVVFPERESGVRLAKNLLSSGFIDLVELSRNVSMVEMDVHDDWVGRSLAELNIRKKYGINIVAVCRNDEVEVDVDPQMPLRKDMKLIVIANTAKLAKLK